jgi:hypothetical protein
MTHSCKYPPARILKTTDPKLYKSVRYALYVFKALRLLAVAAILFLCKYYDMPTLLIVGVAGLLFGMQFASWLSGNWLGESAEWPPGQEGGSRPPLSLGTNVLVGNESHAFSGTVVELSRDSFKIALSDDIISEWIRFDDPNWWCAPAGTRLLSWDELYEQFKVKRSTASKDKPPV